MSPANGAEGASNASIDDPETLQKPASAMKASSAAVGEKPRRTRLPAPQPLGAGGSRDGQSAFRGGNGQSGLTSFADLPPQRTDSVLSRISALNTTFVSPSTGNTYTVFSTILVVTVMLVFGTFNTILNKLQDQTCVQNCSDPDPKNHRGFEQPLWQTLNMFLGEWLCLVILYAFKFVSGFRGWRKSLYRTYYGAIPPELDIDEDVSPPFSPGPVSRPEKSHPACERPPLAKATRPDSSTSGTVGSSRSPWAGYTTPAVHEDEEILIADDEEPVRVGNVGKVPQILISSVERPPLEELSGWRVFLLMIPTVCDIIGTTLMNVGLLYTSASIYQMLRGSVVLCTGILSFFFLRRHLYAFQWMSLFVITLGIAVVGASPLLEDHAPADAFYVQENPERVLAGTFMVLLAQVFTSSQFIIEERLLAKYHLHPMEAIGYEGSFGLLFLFAMAPPAYFFIGQYNPDSWFNIPIGWSQVLSSPYIWGAGLGCIVSIAAFNGSALEVTKRLTATSRSTVDACRTISIWCVSLALGWESFRLLQVCGFVVLLYGTFSFNGIIPPPKFLAPRILDETLEADKQPLLADEVEESERR